MGASRLVIASIVLSLCVAGVWAEEAVGNDAVASDPKASDSAAMEDAKQLRSEIAALEASVADGRRELQNKDDHISKLDKVILEKSDTIDALKDQIESLQRKGALDVEESVRKENTRAAEFEKQVEDIRNELELEGRKSSALEVKAGEAEKQVQELKLEVKKLEEANDEKMHIIRTNEQAVQAAENELRRTQLEVAKKMKELEEVHGAWLPSWMAAHMSYYQVSEKSVRAQKWLEPHMETFRTKWLPAVKERWVILSTIAEPFVQKASITTIKVYAVSRSMISPQIVKVQKAVDPYFQVVKKSSKPYINQVASATKPHVEKARVAFKPFTTWLAPAYMKFVESVITYHHQIEAVVEKHLKKYEQTNSLAIKELAWFAASACLSSIIFIVYRLLSSILCVKKRPPARDARNKPRRRHTNN